MRRIIACFLLFVLIFSALTSFATASAAESAAYSPPQIAMPAVSAECAVLLDRDSRAALSEKNADKRMAPASTTKIMTALVALENSDINDVVDVSPDAVGVEGSSVYLFAGERITMLDLLYAMMLESANDAAAAIAIEVGGSIEEFSVLMNEKASELGLKDTHFVNPHGLYDEEHYTTARELAIIAAEALENEVFRRIVSSKKHTLIPVEGSTRMLYNHNKMLSLYKDAIGVKTGFTKKSGRTLVSAAERDGLTLVAVTLNAPNDWDDHAAMLDAGFASYERFFVPPASFSHPQSVVGGKEGYTILINSEPISLTVPRDMRKNFTLTAEPYARFAFAPLEKGDTAGCVSLYLNGEKLARAELVYASDVETKHEKKGFFEWLKNLFKKVSER